MTNFFMVKGIKMSNLTFLQCKIIVNIQADLYIFATSHKTKGSLNQKNKITKRKIRFS